MESERQLNDIVLIDGVCHLCQRITRFIAKHDKQGKYRFAALQSKAGLRLLRQGGLDGAKIQSFVLVRNGRYYTESGAALRLVAKLGGAWPLLYAFIAVPAPFRNAVYRLVARNRYRWFGKSDVCLMPTPELKARFLEDGI